MLSEGNTEWYMAQSVVYGTVNLWALSKMGNIID